MPEFYRDEFILKFREKFNSLESNIKCEYRRRLKEFKDFFDPNLKCPCPKCQNNEII